MNFALTVILPNAKLCTYGQNQAETCKRRTLHSTSALQDTTSSAFSNITLLVASSHSSFIYEFYRHRDIFLYKPYYDRLFSPTLHEIASSGPAVMLTATAITATVTHLFPRLNFQNMSLKGMSSNSLVRIEFSNSLLTLEHGEIESASLQWPCSYRLLHLKKSHAQ